MLISMAWRNLWRNRRRSILSMAAIAFAEMLLLFVMNFQQGSYKDMISNVLKIHTGAIQVQMKGYQKEQDVNLAFGGADEIMSKMRAMDSVTGVTARAEAPALVSMKDRTFGAMIFGIDPGNEAKVTTLHEVVREGAYLEDGDTKGALVGKLLAKNLGIKVGDEIAFLGQATQGGFAPGLVTVRGIFSLGQKELDANTMFININMMDQAYELNGRVHRIVAQVGKISKIPAILKETKTLLKSENRSKLVALDWGEVSPDMKQMIDMDWNTAQIFYWILLLVVGFGIMNTFLMSFLERIREFGVMMSIGMRPWKVSQLVFVEALMLTVVGIVVGVILGAAVTIYFQVVGIDMGQSAAELYAEYGMSSIIHPIWVTWVAIYSAVAVLFIGVLAAVYPAWKVTKLRPVEAVRYL